MDSNHTIQSTRLSILIVIDRPLITNTMKLCVFMLAVILHCVVHCNGNHQTMPLTYGSSGKWSGGWKDGYFLGSSEDDTPSELTGETIPRKICYHVEYKIIRRGSGRFVMDIKNNGVVIDRIYAAESTEFLSNLRTFRKSFSLDAGHQLSFNMQYPKTEIQIVAIYRYTTNICGTGCPTNFCNHRGKCIDRTFSRKGSECICDDNAEGKHCERIIQTKEPKEVKGMVPDTCSKSDQPIRNCKNTICEKVNGKRMCPYANETNDVTITCNNETTVIRNEISCDCSPCPPTKVTIYGTVFGGDEKLPVRYTFVYFNKSRVDVANRNGDYSVTMNVPDSGKITFKFEDKVTKKFSPLIKTFCVTDADRSIKSDIFLQRIQKKVTVDTSKETEVDFSGNEDLPKTSSLYIPPNAIKNPDGSEVTGEVELGVNFMDPRVESSMDQSPMFFGGTGENSEDQYLSSGMFMISAAQDYNIDVAISQYTTEDTDPATLEGLLLLEYNETAQGWEPMTPIKKGGSKRKKRDLESVLAGDAKIVANRMYNLDVLMRKYCRVRVGVYDVDGTTALNGAIVHAIYQGGAGEWQSFISSTTARDEGACIQVPCDSSDGVASVKITAIKSGEPMHVVGDGVNGIYSIGPTGTVITAVTATLSSLSPEVFGQYGSPCPQTEGMTFKRKEQEDTGSGSNTAVKEINYVPFKEGDELFMKQQNPRFWWPDMDEYEACYIKVKVTDVRSNKNNKELIVTSQNYGGRTEGIDGRYIGTRIVTKEMSSDDSDTVCIQYKCGGKIPELGDDVVDRTLVNIRVQLGDGGYCNYKESSEQLERLTGEDFNPDIGNAVRFTNPTSYEMYSIEERMTGTAIGIVKESSSQEYTQAKTKALETCQNEYGNELNDGVALHFECRDNNNW